MTPIRLFRSTVTPALLGLGLATLSACGAINTLNSASTPLNTYQLVPTPGPGNVGRSNRVLMIASPSSSGAINSERVLIKPSPLQVTYLGGATWVDAAPAHVQDLLMRSLANSGRIGYVGDDGAGPLPDYVLLTDITDFQGEVGAGDAPDTVRIRVILTLVRDSDRRVIGTRTFERVAQTSSESNLALISAFNAAMTPLLAEATAWTVNAMAGRVS